MKLSTKEYYSGLTFKDMNVYHKDKIVGKVLDIKQVNKNYPIEVEYEITDTEFLKEFSESFIIK